MKRHQIGVTLIEMMVSLLLSTSLIAGVGSLFVQMQKSNRIQNSYSDMMDDSRYAMEMLQKEVRRACSLRSRDDANGVATTVFVADNAVFGTGMSFAAGECIKGDATGNLANDAFIIRYQLNDQQDLNANNPSNSSSACTQNLVLDNGEDPAVTVHVVTIYFYINAGSIMCKAKRSTGNPGASPAVAITCFKNCGPNYTSVELIGNVAKFAATYGVDSEIAPAVRDYSANYYVAASAVPVNPNNLWLRIVSLKLSLVLQSQFDNLTTTNTSYTIDGSSDITATDKRLYRVFGTSIAIRNQLY